MIYLGHSHISPSVQQLYRLSLARCIHSYWALQLRRPLDRPASPQYDANPSLVIREDDPGLFPMITALILRHFHAPMI